MNLIDNKNCKIFVVNTDSCTDEIYNCLLKYCDEETKQRQKRIEDWQKRVNLITGNVLRKFLLSKYFNIPFSRQKTFYNEFGKPYLMGYPNAHFNISHCGHLVCCAISDNEIGVDLQKLMTFNNNFANYIFEKEEIANLIKSQDIDLDFTTLWTKKESYLKLIGKGFVDYKKKQDYDVNYSTYLLSDDYVITYCQYKK